ncbi:unnamed protein product [Closterium sp. NIES-64]|nr:unnamed protein product [Closterium sp. NIES-64]
MNRGGNPASNRAAARQHHQARRDDDHHESPAAPSTVTKPDAAARGDLRGGGAAAEHTGGAVARGVGEEQGDPLTLSWPRPLKCGGPILAPTPPVLQPPMGQARTLAARTLAFRKAHANIDATIRAVETVLDKFDIPQQVGVGGEMAAGGATCMVR